MLAAIHSPCVTVHASDAAIRPTGLCCRRPTTYTGPMAKELRPLSQGNRFQRAYAAWAAPYYVRMSPHLAVESEKLDRWLYSRGGLLFWAGMLLGCLASAWGLVSLGLPVGTALLVSGLLWSFALFAFVAAWMMPERFGAARLIKAAARIVPLAYLGALVGFFAGHLAKPAQWHFEGFWAALVAASAKTGPVMLALIVAMLFVLWGVAQIRRWQDERELAALRVAQGAEVQARQAAEAQLRLLQAQIQPHFIFNTLAAVQQAVDTADPQAGPLLRSLTAFLRGSTEMLTRSNTSLGEELDMVRHYLAIMQARLGHRLTSRVDADEAAAALVWPPGLLLTLVENAVEHGVASTLQGGHVRVAVTREGQSTQVLVQDDGAGLAPGWQEGLGLTNCRQRLQHHFGGRAILELHPQAPGCQACIRIQDEAIPA